jgi:phosphohistidine phosphatase
VRTILVMRHASATEDHSDHERPLTAAGEAESARIGEWIRDRGHRPEQALSSSAARAVSTAKAVLSALDTKPPLSIDRNLYLASCGQILDRISELDDESRSVLLVVHNPGAAHLAAWLLASATPEVESRAAAGFEPGTIAVFAFDRPRWTDLVQHGATLVDFTTPRQIA